MPERTGTAAQVFVDHREPLPYHLPGDVIDTELALREGRLSRTGRTTRTRRDELGPGRLAHIRRDGRTAAEGERA